MKRLKHACSLCLWAFSTFTAGAWAGPQEMPCQRNQLMEQWLDKQTPRWNRQLAVIDGFEAPGGIEICLVQSGSPRADYAANRIWLRHLDYEEDRRSLAHEYLHLAFKHSPRALDEAFIEATARQILEGNV
jgi:uncharacterized protein YfaQ (DUF2300 family)